MSNVHYMNSCFLPSTIHNQCATERSLHSLVAKLSGKPISHVLFKREWTNRCLNTTQTLQQEPEKKKLISNNSNKIFVTIIFEHKQKKKYHRLVPISFTPSHTRPVSHSLVHSEIGLFDALTQFSSQHQWQDLSRICTNTLTKKRNRQSVKIKRKTKSK